MPVASYPPPYYFLLFSLLIFILVSSAHWHYMSYQYYLFFCLIHPIATPLSTSSYLFCQCLLSLAVFFQSWQFVRGRSKWNLQRCWIQNCNTLPLTSLCCLIFLGLIAWPSMNAFLGNFSKWKSADFQVLVSNYVDNYFLKCSN